nr:hypothetical protein [Methanothermus fervidus]
MDVIVNGKVYNHTLFVDPWYYEGLKEGWSWDHFDWKTYYDLAFKITIKWQRYPWQKYPIPVFTKDVYIHYKNLRNPDGSDAGFEEVISLCIAGEEALSLDPIRAGYEAVNLNSMSNWERAAYGTFLTGFKTLYMWLDAVRIVADNLGLSYREVDNQWPLFIICGVTNGVRDGAENRGTNGYTYIHVPSLTLQKDYYYWSPDSDPSVLDKKVKIFNIAKGLILKELEAIILRKIGIDAASPVEEVLDALKNGNAIIDHDPDFIKYLKISAPTGSYIFVDLANNGQTIAGKDYYSEIPTLGEIYGAAGQGGACYHYELTQKVPRIVVKDWNKLQEGLVELIFGLVELARSEGLDPMAYYAIYHAIYHCIGPAIEIRYT